MLKHALEKVMLGADISECVAPAELRTVAESMGHVLDVGIMEVYSPERVAKLCRKHGLTPDCSLALTKGFDFDRAWEIVRRDKPHTVIGSLPCTNLSALQELNKCLCKDDPVWMKKFDDLQGRPSVM